MESPGKKSLREVCRLYYLILQRMEKIREESGCLAMYFGTMNSERIRLHEELLEKSGPSREDALILTDSLFEVKNAEDFYQKVKSLAKKEVEETTTKTVHQRG